MSLLNPRHLLAPLENRTHLGIILAAALLVGAFRWVAGTSIDRDSYMEPEAGYSQGYMAEDSAVEDLSMEGSAGPETANSPEGSLARGRVEAQEEYSPSDNSDSAPPAPSEKIDLSDIEKEMGL